MYVTDAPTAQNGNEAHITDMPNRQRVGEHTVGYAVGVYTDEHCNQVSYIEHPTGVVGELGTHARAALRRAVWPPSPTADNTSIEG